jgi:hypothetical protein
VSKRQIGRPKARWEDDVLGDIRCMNVNNWEKVAQNRDRWKKVVERVRRLYRLIELQKKKSRTENCKCMAGKWDI